MDNSKRNPGRAILPLLVPGLASSHAQDNEDSCHLEVVNLEFIILEDGSVANLEIINSTDESLNERVVNKNGKFEPGILNGKAVRREARLAFEIPSQGCMQLPGQTETEAAATDMNADLAEALQAHQQEPVTEHYDDPELHAIAMVEPSYPEEALDSCIGGWELLEFRVTCEGLVRDITVIGQDECGLFGEPAVIAVKDRQFVSATFDGKPAALDALLPLDFKPPLDCLEHQVSARAAFCAEHSTQPIAMLG